MDAEYWLTQEDMPLVGPRAIENLMCVRRLDAARTFSALAADLRAEPLAEAEAERWLARAREESTAATDAT